MIDYMKRNDIFGDFGRNLSNSKIARIRGVSRKRPARHISVSIGFLYNFAQFGGVCQVL